MSNLKTNTNTEASESNELHEIHISVEPTQLLELKKYCLLRKFKPILACSDEGDNKHQLMISKYKSGTKQDCINKALYIEKDMLNYGLNVIRVKVESMLSNSYCPKGDEKPDTGCYFEYHIKFDIENDEDYNKLKKISKKYNGNCSYNLFSKNFNPIITLRSYNKSYNEFNNNKDNLFNELKMNNLKTSNFIHKEYCIYDTYSDLDNNWLSKNS
jgi:hypothetical protein